MTAITHAIRIRGRYNGFEDLLRVPFGNVSELHICGYTKDDAVAKAARFNQGSEDYVYEAVPLWVRPVVTEVSAVEALANPHTGAAAEIALAEVMRQDASASTMNEFLRARLGTQKWCVAPRLTGKLKERGYEAAVSQKRYTEMQREFESQQPAAPKRARKPRAKKAVPEGELKASVSRLEQMLLARIPGAAFIENRHGPVDDPVLHIYLMVGEQCGFLARRKQPHHAGPEWLIYDSKRGVQIGKALTYQGARGKMLMQLINESKDASCP